MSDENEANNQEINIQISLISEKILNEIVDYIKNNTENPKKIMKKLTKIYNYIINIFSNTEDIVSDNICTLPNEEKKEYTLNSLQQSITKDILPNNRYLVFKLKRQLKQEQEKNKLRELDYLEKLFSLQKQLKTIQDEKNPTLNQKFKTEMIKDTNLVGKKNDEVNEKCITKGLKSKKHYSVANIRFKQGNKTEIPIISNIKSNRVSSNEFNSKSKINSPHNEKPKIGRNNCIPELELNSNEVVNNVYHKTVNDFIDKYRVKMYSKVHQKIKNINFINKHNFNEIRESVEKGRKKIRLIKDSISPALFYLRNMKIEKV